MPEAFLFDGLLPRLISSSGDDCYSVPEADAHGDAPAAPTPTPTPTATSPADAHDEDRHPDDEREFVEHVGVVLASFGARALAMLGEIRAWPVDNVALYANFRRADQPAPRAASWAYQSSDIWLKRAMESRSQPRRDVP